MKKITRKRLMIYAAIIFVLSIFCFWQNNMLTVSDYSYDTDKIAEGLDGFKIVQISDLHNKSFGKDNKHLLEKIAELNPDIIVLTGDIVDSDHTDIPKVVDFVRGAVNIAPTYYISGNHEYWLSDSEFDDMISEIKKAGSVYLSDESVAVEKSGSEFVLIGINDCSLENFSVKCPKLNDNELNVVLAHEPQFIDTYSTHGNIDLVLSGHAHGGQFVLPFVGGIVAPDQGFFPKYTDGMYKSGSTSMIVSRGLGNSVIPVRLFNFPDIVCITLNKK